MNCCSLVREESLTAGAAVAVAVVAVVLTVLESVLSLLLLFVPNAESISEI